MTVICFKCLHVHTIAERLNIPYDGKHRIDPKHTRSACPKCNRQTFIKTGER